MQHNAEIELFTKPSSVMFDRRLVQHFDWVLLALALALQGIGILTLYSAVNASADVASVSGPVYLKQSYWFAIGSAGMMVMLFFNYKWLHRWGGLIYVVSIALLVAVGLVFAARPEGHPTVVVRDQSAIRDRAARQIPSQVLQHLCRVALAVGRTFDEDVPIRRTEFLEPRFQLRRISELRPVIF